jgi:hypothetical protein
MPYVIDLAASLAQVLNRGAALAPHRVAGYAANAEFWLGEIEHCFAVLDGFEKRFYAMRRATTAYVTDHPINPGRSDAYTGTTNNIKDSELKEARAAVARAARAFFRRCEKLQLLSNELLARADRLVNLELDD